MNRYAFVFFFFTGCLTTLRADDTGKNKTYTYAQTIDAYRALAKKSKHAALLECGKTDSGKPLHLLVLSKEGLTRPPQDDKRAVVLINNGIHPGEPDGINASLDLAREITTHPDKYKTWLDNLIICIIPIYNVGGSLNRGCCSRANQDGPEAYGFRGNARNLDLNRDFVKADSRNAKSFTGIFRSWKPHLLIDTHVSNGADYQYTFTYILSQKDKLTLPLQPFYDTFEKELHLQMEKYNHKIVPYVNTLEHTPDKGIQSFIESPRYATGYAALFNCFGITIETHMLKPFDERVKATYDGLISMLQITSDHRADMLKNKQEADAQVARTQWFALNYRNDTTVSVKIPFYGFAYSYPISKVTGLPILHYDRNKPVTWNIPFYAHCVATDTVKKPAFYIIPQAWTEVIERLTMNGVALTTLEKDTVMHVTSTYIDSLKYSGRPYEGHFLHHQVHTTNRKQDVAFSKGDYLLKTGNETDRFVVEMLEPRSADSYFCWNFFDEILQQKEWFSDYVFDQKAGEILESNPSLKKRFDDKKMQDEQFARDSWAQLYFIYAQSEFMEITYNRYPVFRIDR